MAGLSDADKALYFQRSFVAVDGLWFMKVEEKQGFDDALDADCAVWKVMPKIQARTLKSLTGLEHGLEELHRCLITKFDLEGFRYESRWNGDRSFLISISGCPWYDALLRAGRAHLAEKVGKCICTAEYGAWAREFGDTITFKMLDYLCGGANCCVLKYREEAETLHHAGDSG
jgi:hypothetical protein